MTKSPSNKPATGDENKAPPNNPPASGGYTRKRKMNMSVYSMAHQEHLIVEVTDRPYDAPMPGLARNSEGTLPVVPVLNLETGEMALLIMPAVLKQILSSISEPVGRKFEIVRGDIVPGKNYREVEVWELE